MSAILYEGQVTILKRFKGKVSDRIELHNNGTLELFKNLCRFIQSGASTTSIPKYLDLGHCQGEKFNSSKFISILSAPQLAITTELQDEGDAPYVRRKFVLSQNSLISQTDENPLYLVLKSATEILAYVPIVSGGEAVTKYSIAVDESHEIWWKMSFVNVDTSLDQAGGN